MKMQSYREIREAIASHHLTPAEAIRAAYEAITLADGHIHAFTVLADEAMRQRDGAMDGPLAGIAIGIKDIVDTADFPTSYGSPIYENHRPAADAAICAMIRSKGGHIVGKTVTAELAFFHPGPTVNPHDHAHTPGGSSSGSAAAVAAGMVPLAIGTQTGGSVIRPASYCGIAGFKPSFRLIPTVGVKTFSWTLDTLGLFAASVADVAAAAADTTGRHLDQPSRGKPLRIAIWDDDGRREVSADMAAAVERIAGIAGRQGHQVITLKEPEAMIEADLCHGLLQEYEGALSLAHEMRTAPQLLSDKLRDALEGASRIDSSAYDGARRTARRARLAARELFDEVDIVLSPAATGAAPRGLASTGSAEHNRLWTLLGCPAVTFRADRDGPLPLGIQMTARFGKDALLLAAAAELEAVSNAE
ncbi:amidase [Notoacmeibacter sp. MSK16QG-6]|uniref:amidase n=1 Tax=Notoacmeibacter sp. MSK16QG-6 TaxID=2957982 RepID=UPI00209EC3B8|nr:amidase [Notoacmeibacter sp. MSK16QG-6]MCP1199726.1 amidase [Notoacmeibacter sp. MSK16QG-6]